MTPQQLLKLSEAYAEKSGFQIAPDKAQVQDILKDLLLNEKKFGYRFCPCRIITGNFDKDRLIICPCIYHKSEIAQQGSCLCNFFSKKD